MRFSPVRRSQQLVMSRASSGRERTFAHFTMSDFNGACDACGSPYPLLFFSSRRELTAFQADVKAGRAILSFLCRCSDTWRQFACRGSGLPMLALISILSRENASPAQTLWHQFGTWRNIGPIWTYRKGMERTCALNRLNLGDRSWWGADWTGCCPTATFRRPA